MANSKPIQDTGKKDAWWNSKKDRKTETQGQPSKITKLAPLCVKTTDDVKNCLITGLDLTWDGKIVVADRDNGKVKLITYEGEVVSSVTVPEKPNDVAVINASELAVCMWFQLIGIVKMTAADEMILKDTFKLDYNVWAITSFDGSLIITCATEPRSVKMITTGGDVLWSVATSSDGTVLFDSPYFITSSVTTDGNTVVVSDQSMQTLTVLDARTGNIRRIYDVENEPRGVALDDDDNIYYCCDTGEISVRLRDSDKEIFLADKHDGMKRLSSMEMNLHKNELLFSTVVNDPKTGDFLYRFKLNYETE